MPGTHTGQTTGWPAPRELTTQWGERSYCSHKTTRSKALGNHNANITSQVLFTGWVQHFTLCKDDLSRNDDGLTNGGWGAWSGGNSPPL